MLWPVRASPVVAAASAAVAPAAAASAPRIASPTSAAARVPTCGDTGRWIGSGYAGGGGGAEGGDTTEDAGTNPPDGYAGDRPRTARSCTRIYAVSSRSWEGVDN